MIAPKGMPLFNLGQIVMTPGADAAFRATGEDPFVYVFRHVTGDFGDLDAEDRAENKRAVRDGNRILSAYKLADGTRIWLITEWDRSVTTLLLPEEY